MNTLKKEKKVKSSDSGSDSKVLTPFQKMLLNGPVINDDQVKEYQKIITKSRKWKV